jgi:hypothetical protein
MLLLEVLFYHLTSEMQQLLLRRWPPIKARIKNVPRKRGGGMHQLKEVDLLSAKMDLLMKKLED